jgi:Glycosyl transferase 4-like domain
MAPSSLRTVLILSRFFPPSFSIGGKRAYRFAKHLADHGWRAVVLTDVEPAPERSDPSVPALGPPHRVVRQWFPSSWSRGNAPDSDGTVARPTRTRIGPPRWLMPRLKWHVSMPIGREALNAPRVVQTVARLAKEERADAIFATSGPYASLLFGALAKRATGLPLHLDLRDPWSMNFMQRTKSPWTRRTEAAVEARLLRAADRVTFTCDAARDAYRAAYPDIAGRIDRIFNAFDPAEQPARSSQDPQAPLSLVHFGNCYGARRLDTVIRAIARLHQRDGVTADDLSLLNLGRMAELDVRLVDELGIGAFVTSRPVVPYREGVERLAAADLQLLVAYGREHLFVPGKLYDYLLTGRPILCIAPESEVTDIVARTGSGRSVTPDDVDACAEVIGDALAAKRAGRAFAVADPDQVTAFSAPTTTAQLAAMLDDIAG